MNILHIIEAPSWTGAMAQTYELATGLMRRGHGVTLVCTPGSVLHERARDTGVEVIALDLRSELNLLVVARLCWTVWTRRVEIIHAHRAHAHSLGLLAAWMTGRPFVVTRRVSFRPRENLGSRIKYRTRLLSKAIAVSNAVRDVLMDFGVSSEKIRVIYSGTDPSRYRPDLDGSGVRCEFGIPPDAPLVGKIANFYHGWKGHDTFLEAAKMVCARLPDARFLVVGEKTESPRARSTVEALGLGDRVILAGYRADVPEIMAALDVSVNSSRAGEGLSGAIRESLAAGKPVVATDVGGNSELVIDGETGLLVAPDDPRGLADAVLKLLTDSETAAALAANGRRYVTERLTVERMVEETERVYREILCAPGD